MQGHQAGEAERDGSDEMTILRDRVNELEQRLTRMTDAFNHRGELMDALGMQLVEVRKESHHE